MKRSWQTIWTFWAGDMPEHIKLCQETVARNAKGWSVECLDVKEARRLVQWMRKDWEDIPVPAHQADYLRAHLLYSFGGFWMDSDIILLGGMGRCRKAIEREGYFFTSRPRKPFIGFMGCRPDHGRSHDLMKAWIDGMDKKLDRSLKQKWPALGADILWSLIKMPVATQPGNLVIPFLPRRWKALFRNGRMDKVLPSDALGVHLFNEASAETFGSYSRQQLLESPMLVSQVFRKALA